MTATSTYTVTASNNAGSTQVGLVITVNAGPAAPSGLSYSFNPAVYTIGVGITPNSPSSSGGAVTSFGVTPSLPAGLSLNTSTGVISGTPTTVAASNTYTVTASNSAGSTQAGLVITVNSGLVVNTFSTTGSLGVGRTFHTATLLPNGRVLIAGGNLTDGSGNVTSSAELFNPSTGTFSPTGAMGRPRAYQTATLLLNGKVLIAGGANNFGDIQTAEIYDPASGVFSDAAAMLFGRHSHSATALPSGKILIAGGSGSAGWLKVAELYDPFTGTFAATGSLNIGRGYCPGTLLLNGKVLVAGGLGDAGSLSSSELYDPITESFSSTGPLATTRSDYAAILLPNGKVLIAGGTIDPFKSALEIYDPVAGSFSPTGSLPPGGQGGGTSATLLPNGKVLLSGGSYSATWTQAYLYDQGSGQTQLTGAMSEPRAHHTATLLPNGQVLLTGGPTLNSTIAELFYSSTTLGNPEGLYLGTVHSFYSGLTSNAIAMASANNEVCMTDLQNLVFFNYATGTGTLYAHNQTTGQPLSIISPYVNPSTWISGTYQVPSVANDQFGLSYNPLYTQANTVASLAGNYSWTEIRNLVQVSNPATLDALGNISGTNAQGVTFTGTLVQTDSSKNLYTVAIRDANGHTYSGLAFWAPPGSPTGFVPNAILLMVRGTNTDAAMGGFFTHN